MFNIEDLWYEITAETSIPDDQRDFIKDRKTFLKNQSDDMLRILFWLGYNDELSDNEGIHCGITEAIVEEIWRRRKGEDNIYDQGEES